VTGAVLVTGATGTVGRSLVGELLAAGQVVRAGVLVPGAAGLPPDAEPVRLDFHDPTTAAPALVGVDRLFLLRPPAISDVATALGPLVQAAARVGVRRVVVLSVMGVNPALPHWRMERMVQQAGLPMTALRPSYFAQNLLTAFGDEIRKHSRLRLACGSGRVSFVDTRDVAAVASRVLVDPDAHPAGPRTLTGPQALDFSQVALLLSSELGRQIRYEPCGLLTRRRRLLESGADPAYVRVQLMIDVTTRLGLARRVTRDVQHVLGRPATPLATFVHDHRDGWA
jgi:uncharacterized protein YbjT (DUF2867 family)